MSFVKKILSILCPIVVTFLSIKSGNSIIFDKDICLEIAVIMITIDYSVTFTSNRLPSYDPTLNPFEDDRTDEESALIRSSTSQDLVPQSASVISQDNAT